MAIIVSEIVGQLIQDDGRSYVKERHVDHLAKEYFLEYLADLGTNLQAKLAEHAAQIWENAIQGEISNWLQKLENGVLPDPALINLNYATRVQFLKEAMRWACRNHAVEALKAIGLMTYIKNNYTAAQVAAFLGVSVSVVNAVLARFNLLERDLKPLLDDDATKVVEL